MDYGSIMKYLRGRFYKCYSNTEFYTSNVLVWYDWYKGYVEGSHQITDWNGIKITKRKMYRLRMAKRVCEDWASAIFNEDMSLVINSQNTRSSVFVQGGKGNKGVLGSNNFKTVLSKALEQMFALGSSALVLGVNNVGVDAFGNIVSVTNRSRITIKKYNATQIIPISWDNDIITECAFVSEVVRDNRAYYVLSVHMLEEDGYVIYTEVLDDVYNLSSLDFNILPVLRTHSMAPFFFILTPNIANNVDLDCPLGISVYSNGIDNLLGCDTAYDCCLREIVTGKRIIGMNRALCCKDDSGNEVHTPPGQDTSYFMFFGEEVQENMDSFVKEFHPNLNTEKLVQELKNQLSLLGSAVGLGGRFYTFDFTGGVTATEYIGSQNDFFRNAKKMSRSIQSTVERLVSGILFIGKNMLGLAVDDNAKVVCTVSDGVVESDAEERKQDREDVKDGLMSKVEYRMKWYHESEEVAKEALQKIITNA